MSLTSRRSLPPATNVLIPNQSRWTQSSVQPVGKRQTGSLWLSMLTRPPLSSPSLHFTGGLLSGWVGFLNTCCCFLPPQSKTASHSSQEGKSIEIIKQLLFMLPKQQMNTLPVIFLFFKEVNQPWEAWIYHCYYYCCCYFYYTYFWNAAGSPPALSTSAAFRKKNKRSGWIPRNWNREFTRSTATTGTGNVDRRTEIDRIAGWNEAQKRE